jgi:spore coat polysaccharide biosynthesis predicted glycosyltransferase SpsG
MIFNRYKLTRHKKKNIFFLLGGSKNTQLYKHLPKLVEKKISKEFKLYWVSGKFSDKPKFIDKTRWTLCKDSNFLEKEIPKSSFIFSLYGLSFFEALSCGIPSVAFCTNSNYKKDYKEIEFLKKNKIYFIENKISKSVEALVNLINSKNLHNKFLKNAKKNLRFFTKNLVQFLKEYVFPIIISFIFYNR